VLLFTLLLFPSFSQKRKYEIRLGVGNNFLFNNDQYDYPLFNPAISGSFHLHVSPKTVVGIDLQYEHLTETENQAFATYYVNDQKQSDYWRIKSPIYSIGTSGRTYLVKKIFYLHYGYRFGISNSNVSIVSGNNTVVDFGGSTNRFHMVNFGVGLTFFQTSDVKPFIELSRGFYYVESSELHFPILIKVGLCF
jgi:hypothetical protein